jgi:inosose dehydratase
MSIPIASAPLSWGIYQPESARLPYTQILEEMQATGYAGTELGPWSYLPTDPAQLRRDLRQRDLQLVSASICINLTDPLAHVAGLTQALEVGRLLASLEARLLIVIDTDRCDDRASGRTRAVRLSPDEWQVVTDGVSHIAQVVFDELGLRVVVHPYLGTHIETGDDVRVLLERTDPDLIGLCLDTGHWHYSGGDALAALAEFGPRTWHVHLSDVDPEIRQFSLDEQLSFYEATQAGVLCDLGTGMVNFPAIITVLQASHYAGWLVVEQDALLDEPDAYRAVARRNRDYLRQLGV